MESQSVQSAVTLTATRIRRVLSHSVDWYLFPSVVSIMFAVLAFDNRIQKRSQTALSTQFLADIVAIGLLMQMECSAELVHNLVFSKKNGQSQNQQ